MVQGADAGQLLTAFDVVKHQHEALTADLFNMDSTFKSCLNEVFQSVAMKLEFFSTSLLVVSDEARVMKNLFL